MRVSFFVKKPRHSPVMPVFFASSNKKIFPQNCLFINLKMP